MLSCVQLALLLGSITVPLLIPAHDREVHRFTRNAHNWVIACTAMRIGANALANQSNGAERSSVHAMLVHDSAIFLSGFWKSGDKHTHS